MTVVVLTVVTVLVSCLLVVLVVFLVFLVFLVFPVLPIVLTPFFSTKFCARMSPRVNPIIEVSALVNSGSLSSLLLYAAQRP